MNLEEMSFGMVMEDGSEMIGKIGDGDENHHGCRNVNLFSVTLVLLGVLESFIFACMIDRVLQAFEGLKSSHS
jgi:ABC-type proline/glycine betaine transport system permease subunit